MGIKVRRQISGIFGLLWAITGLAGAENLKFVGWQSDYYYILTAIPELYSFSVTGTEAIYKTGEGFVSDGCLRKSLGDNLLIGPGDLVWCQITNDRITLKPGEVIKIFRPRQWAELDLTFKAQIKFIGRLRVEKENSKNFLVARVEMASEPLQTGDWLICAGQ